MDIERRTFLGCLTSLQTPNVFLVFCLMPVLTDAGHNPTVEKQALIHPSHAKVRQSEALLITNDSLDLATPQIYHETIDLPGCRIVRTISRVGSIPRIG